MIKNTKTSSKQIQDVTVECLYNKKNIKAFRVSIKEGVFTVIDYADRFGKKPDTEVFWERYVDQVKPHMPEYKIVNKYVTEFLSQR